MAKDSTFGADTLEFIAQLQAAYGSDPSAEDSCLLSGEYLPRIIG
ncbi:hypothetical protein [uncultured Roseobacter sp.]|nr:hypothetical protein [uncultured Roseobacter sp.]